MKSILQYLLFLLVSIPLHSQIIITEVNYDTPFYEGSPNDHYYQDQNTTRRHLGEYIELYNFSNEDIPLKGWFITDYSTKYVFPDDAVIPAEDFIIIAYNDPQWYESSYGYNSENYFTTFYPTALGKESQIYYQNKIILRNTLEPLKLFIGELRGVETNYNNLCNVSWENPSNHPFIFSSDATDNPTTHNFYQWDSVHLESNGAYQPNVPSPFSSAYLPPTQDLEDIQSVIDALYDVYNNLTWEDYSDEILFNTCLLVLNVIEQAPYETYTDERRCFEYDNSGNKISSYDCSEEEDDEESGGGQTEYTSAELEEINSKISLHPNPTSSIINIQWDDSINGKIQTIFFSNHNGTSIGSLSIGSSQSSVQFDFSGQPTGIYIVSFVLDSGQMLSRNVMKL